MSSPGPQSASVPPATPGPREITIYSHSMLFYWWPVWAFGLILGTITWYNASRMVIVPPGMRAETFVEVKYPGGSSVPDREVLLFPEKYDLRESYKDLIDEKAEKRNKDNIEKFEKSFSEAYSPKYLMHPSKNLGVFYVTILLIIIIITNVPLRGLWSFILLLSLAVLALALSLAGWWGQIWSIFGLLHIHINAGGYFFISLVLLVVWAINVFIFDRRRYITVSSGQIRVREEIGAGETVYDATGLTFQKKQDDMFRHWVVGMGSGDLVILKTATNQEIDMPNVLFVGSKIRQVEQLIKEREVV